MRLAGLVMLLGLAWGGAWAGPDDWLLFMRSTDVEARLSNIFTDDVLTSSSYPYMDIDYRDDVTTSGLAGLETDPVWTAAQANVPRLDAANTFTAAQTMTGATISGTYTGGFVKNNASGVLSLDNAEADPVWESEKDNYAALAEDETISGEWTFLENVAINKLIPEILMESSTVASERWFLRVDDAGVDGGGLQFGTSEIGEPEVVYVRFKNNGVTFFRPVTLALETTPGFVKNDASGILSGGNKVDELSDADGDTLVQVEESADDDTIRFDAGAGGERMTISPTAITATGPVKVDDLQIENATITNISAGDVILQPEDDRFFIVKNASGSIGFQYNFELGQIQFDSLLDTNLYRSAANVLKTDDAFQAASFATGTTERISSAGAFTGTGAAITGLDAGNLASGTVPDARFPATLPAASGANLTNLNGSNVATGTVDQARLDGNVAMDNEANTFTEAQAVTKSTNGALSGWEVTNASNGTAAISRLRLVGDAVGGYFGTFSSGYTGVTGWADTFGLVAENSASGGMKFLAASGYFFQVVAGTTALFIEPTTGDVGIGNTAPDDKLDVTGAVDSTGGYEVDNTVLIDGDGYIALKSSTDAAAPNSRMYYSTTQGKPVWKDAGGTVNVLY